MKGDVGNKIVGKQVQMYLCNKLIFVLPLKPYYNYKNVIVSNQYRFFTSIATSRKTRVTAKNYFLNLHTNNNNVNIIKYLTHWNTDLLP